VGGWQDELKEGLAASMLDTLEGSLYPGLRKKIIFMKTASPLSIMDRFGSSEGAVTGWSMEDRPPVPRSLAGIMAAPRTALPSVYKAGQWSYSPSGVPIAVFTGRLAARAICAELGCRRNGRG
jgi:phytoene dehydrogenase-like protein